MTGLVYFMGIGYDSAVLNLKCFGNFVKIVSNAYPLNNKTV